MDCCEREVLTTRMGKPSLVVGGYQHRIHRKNNNGISWVCIKDRKSNCKGGVKTTLQHEIISTTDHTCIPNVAEIEVKKKLENCRKRVMEEISVPVHTVYKQEFSELYSRGYDLVAEIPKYSNVKTRLYKERRNVLATEQNPQDRPLPELVEYNLEPATVLQKMEMTQNILERSKTAASPANTTALSANTTLASANTTCRYGGGGRPLEKRPRQEVVEDEVDDDRLFMLSLAGKMKHLSPADNMQFRLEVQQLLLNKLCPDGENSRRGSRGSPGASRSSNFYMEHNSGSSSSSSFAKVMIKEEVHEDTLTDENVITVADAERSADEIKTEILADECNTVNNTDFVNMDYN